MGGLEYWFSITNELSEKYNYSFACLHWYRYRNDWQFISQSWTCYITYFCFHFLSPIISKLLLQQCNRLVHHQDSNLWHWIPLPSLHLVYWINNEVWVGVGEIDPEGPGSLPETAKPVEGSEPDPEGSIPTPTQNELMILVLPQQF